MLSKLFKSKRKYSYRVWIYHEGHGEYYTDYLPYKKALETKNELKVLHPHSHINIHAFLIEKSKIKNQK